MSVKRFGNLPPFNVVSFKINKVYGYLNGQKVSKNEFLTPQDMFRKFLKQIFNVNIF